MVTGMFSGDLFYMAAGQVADMSMGQIIISAFSTSDGVGKGIVIMLIIASIWSWTILASKWLAVGSMESQCNKFLKKYESVHSALAMGLYLGELKGPLKNICAKGLKELFEICNISDRNRDQFMRNAVVPRRLTQAELDKIRSSMNQQINQESLELDEGLGWISIFVTVSPFLGLFGTVWGVMATFTNIADSGSIEISRIAPGISGALLTTVAGLVVAVPSVIGNIKINETINTVNQKMDIFLEDFIASLQLEDSHADSDM